MLPEPYDDPPGTPSFADEFYTGSWEHKGRSTSAAAFFGFMLIGIIYMFGQTILTTIPFLTSGIGQTTTGDMVERMAHEMESMSGAVRVVVVVSQYLMLLLPTIWLVRRWHTFHVRDYIRFRRFPVVEVLLAVLITIALMPTGSFVADLIKRAFDFPDGFMSIDQGVFTASSPGEFLWLVFVIAVTPAICEETFFRGYIQRTFERSLGWKSLILTGVFFGLFHFQPVGLFTLVMIGVVLGYFYYRSKSLAPSMAAHFTNNFIVVGSLYYGEKLGGVDLAADSGMPFLWVAITLPVAIVLLLIYHRVTRGRVDPVEEAMAELPTVESPASSSVLTVTFRDDGPDGSLS